MRSFGGAVNSVRALWGFCVLFFCMNAVNSILTIIIIYYAHCLSFPLSSISFCERFGNTNFTCQANEASWNWKKLREFERGGWWWCVWICRWYFHEMTQKREGEANINGQRRYDRLTDSTRVKGGRVEQTGFCNHTFSVLPKSWATVM